MIVAAASQCADKAKQKSIPKDTTARSKGTKKRRLDDAFQVTQSHYNSEEDDESQDENWVSLLPTKEHRLQKPGTKRGAKVIITVRLLIQLLIHIILYPLDTASWFIIHSLFFV